MGACASLTLDLYIDIITASKIKLVTFITFSSKGLLMPGNVKHDLKPKISSVIIWISYLLIML